jgi:hypothetical protein
MHWAQPVNTMVRAAAVAATLSAMAVSCVASGGSGWTPPAPTPSPSPAGPSEPPTPSPIGTAFPTSQPAASVTIEPAGSMSRVHFDRLVFDVPLDWTWRPANVNEHYVNIVGFVGTAPSTAGCFPMPTSPPQTGASMCTWDLHLFPGTVSLVLETQDGPPMLGFLGDPVTMGPGDTVIAVDGVPAVLGETTLIPGGDGRSLSLRLTHLAAFNQTYALLANVRGPDVDALLAEVRQVFASVHYEPPPTPLPTDAAAESAVLRNALDQLGATDPAYACFPRTAGAERSAVITSLPNTQGTTRPLSVVCRSEVEPLVQELWRITLTVEWGTRGDPATSAVMTELLRPDGGFEWSTGPSNSLP